LIAGRCLLMRLLMKWGLGRAARRLSCIYKQLTPGYESKKLALVKKTGFSFKGFGRKVSGGLKNIGKSALSGMGSVGGLMSKLPIGAAGANPYVAGALAVAGALTAVGVAAWGAAKKADQFYEVYKGLLDLNQEKSASQMKNLRNTILDASMAKGLSANQLAKGAYDVQSATGIFGKGSVQIAQKVGSFAQATGADFDAALNATTKTMKAFGLGVKDVDRILAASASTVKAGITTFEELARVQAEYAGMASSAGQSVETANKVFAVFTSLTKDSSTAATAVKGAFQDMSKLIEPLQAMGINISDANGNFRQLDKIMIDLSPKLSNLSDMQFAQLKKSIGGNEGLVMLLNAAKNGGDELLKTFQTFDKSKFSVDKALSQVSMGTEQQKLQNRLDTLKIQLGETLRPFFVELLQDTSNLLKGIVKGWRKIKNSVNSTESALKSLYERSVIIRLVFDKLKNVFSGWGKNSVSALDMINKGWAWINKQANWLWELLTKNTWFGGLIDQLDDFEIKAVIVFDRIRKLAQSHGNFLQNIFTMNFEESQKSFEEIKKGYTSLFNISDSEFAAYKKRLALPKSTPKKTKPINVAPINLAPQPKPKPLLPTQATPDISTMETPISSKKEKVSSGVRDGGGRPVVNIRIDKLVENVYNEGDMNKVFESLTRVIRGAAQTAF